MIIYRWLCVLFNAMKTSATSTFISYLKYNIFFGENGLTILMSCPTRFGHKGNISSHGLIHSSMDYTLNTKVTILSFLGYICILIDANLKTLVLFRTRGREQLRSLWPDWVLQQISQLRLVLKSASGIHVHQSYNNPSWHVIQTQHMKCFYNKYIYNFILLYLNSICTGWKQIYQHFLNSLNIRATFELKRCAYEHVIMLWW